MDKNQKIMALGNQACVSSTQLIHKLIVPILGCLSLFFVVVDMDFDIVVAIIYINVNIYYIYVDIIYFDG